jgi:phospholipid transport system transporter-binding protein
MGNETVSPEDGKLRLAGPITIQNVSAVLRRGTELLDAGDVLIDLEQVAEVDSSAVSMLLEWEREARRRNCRIRYAHMPENLRGLLQLYDVAGLIPGMNSQASVP